MTQVIVLCWLYIDVKQRQAVFYISDLFRDSKKYAGVPIDSCTPPVEETIDESELSSQDQESFSYLASKLPFK